MYNPARFKSENTADALELIHRFPFATVITAHEQGSWISHLPLIAKKTADGPELIGHLARANAHWKFLHQHHSTFVFHGPHTYISPKWYPHDGVPTWNYSVVHVHGQVELIEDDEAIIGCIQDLSQHAEQQWPSGWEFWIPDTLNPPQLSQAIVGFRVRSLQINYKTKLSQNRSAEDRIGVLKALSERQDENSRGVLHEMKKLYGPDGEFL